jgi:hypothetical protein
MSAITFPSDKTPPQPTPARQRIGAGSFATVFIVHGGPCAYKVIHDTTNAETLLKEYTMLSSLHLTCNPDSFFALPRPFVFHNPQTNVLTVQPHRSLHRSPRLTFSAETFSTLGFTAPTYVMDRVFVLPLRISNPIRDLYYPPHAKETNPPPLCRLYFGKVLDVAPVQTSRPNHFFNSSNFPLDVARYTALAARLPLPPVAEVVEGMGEMLARLHWRGNVDGRDIEFVMGGDGYEGISFFVIDFNQARHTSSNSAVLSVCLLTVVPRR